MGAEQEKLTVEEFEAIMDDESIAGVLAKEDGCNALKGLNIIAKYLPNTGIEGADHDEIWSADIDELCEAGITKEDAEMLQKYNWMTKDGYLARFV